MKPKIGILGCGYNCAENLDEIMKPWFAAAASRDFVFSFVSAQFKEYQDLNLQVSNTPTVSKMLEYVEQNKVQFVEVPDKPMFEHEARNLALRNLMAKNCDYIWLLDLSDEYYTYEQIVSICSYIQINKSIAWYSIPFKNYVFDGKQWIDGFCPPRIFKVEPNVLVSLHDFYWDNDVRYSHNNDDITMFDYKNLLNMPITKEYISGGVRHMTWLHSNGEAKVKYQFKHFGHCSYRWNETAKQLEFDPEFHKKHNLPLPILRND